ncbi:Tetratricopeptide repeat protein 28 [Portunus trituberculatus]|uniref:Tetratricopeptide repeat protein 28 n=1 Tax=Portunus trituberculatus TaxID=210409 RepID=A0A5B7IQ22_PORTR|nr:Tetratricopeptide repeat protein 28 [Portunus trituberculatus]
MCNSECLPQAYYRQGVALQCLGRHADALAAFSSGLAQDPKSLQLLAGLVEAAMKSPLRGQHSEKLPSLTTTIFKDHKDDLPSSKEYLSC